MREGFVIMLDALGFKGIWRPVGAESEAERARAVLEKMTRVRGYAEKSRVEADARSTITMRCDCISDTIVIGVWPTEEAPTRGMPLIIAATWAKAFCEGAIQGAIPLAYRGAVSRGKFEMENGFIIGPAVDEAADNMERAEGAFVWFTPSALSFVTEEIANEQVGGLIAHEHTVPLKAGASFQTFVIPPWVKGDLAGKAETAQAVLTSFNKPDLGIQIKRQNTARFFNAALEKEHRVAKMLAQAKVLAEVVPETPPVVR